jgi:hypothetical protein
LNRADSHGKANMMRVCVQRFSLLYGVIFIGTLTSVSAQSNPSSTPDSHSHVLELPPFPDSQTKRMTVDDVIKMSKAGRSDEAIIEQLKKEGQYFNLTADQLAQLKAAHVSNQVIQVMIDPYPVRDSPPSSPEKSPAVQSAHGEGCTDCVDRCDQAYKRCVDHACGGIVYRADNAPVCHNEVYNEDQFNHDVVIKCGGQRVTCKTNCGRAGGPCNKGKP